MRGGSINKGTVRQAILLGACRTQSSKSESFDVVVIGAGHKELTCAGYRAYARLKATVLAR